MIDELYLKEKKYVKQYLREDYIEKNNFIFDLQKSHKLHTSKDIKNAKVKNPYNRKNDQRVLIGDSSVDKIQVTNNRF